jgi:hypothetical protein
MVIKPAMEIRQSDDLGFPSQSQSFMSFFRMTRHMLPILIARVGLSALVGFVWPYCGQIALHVDASYI